MPTNCVLRTYCKHSFRPKGKISVRVKCNGNSCTLDLLVVKGNGPTLTERDWIRKLKPKWSFVNRVAPESVQ